MKLLQGQQLYISKHVHGQLLHENITHPPPTPPITRLNPCITATTTGGQLLDFPAIAVVTGTPSPPWRTGHRIGEASYEFREVPETFPLTRLYTSEYGWWETTIPTIDSWLKLATIHWLRCSLHFDVLAKIGPFYFKWCRMRLHPEPATCSAVGDTYYGDFTLDDFGPLAIAISFAVHDPANLEYYVQVINNPSGAQLKAYGGVNGFAVPFWES